MNEALAHLRQLVPDYRPTSGLAEPGGIPARNIVDITSKRPVDVQG
jgi:hypothetical protein